MAIFIVFLGRILVIVYLMLCKRFSIMRRFRWTQRSWHTPIQCEVEITRIIQSHINHLHMTLKLYESHQHLKKSVQWRKSSWVWVWFSCYSFQSFYSPYFWSTVRSFWCEVHWVCCLDVISIYFVKFFAHYSIVFCWCVSTKFWGIPLNRLQ